MRQTPYRGIRYPYASDVVDPVALQTEAQDIDQALVNDDQLRTEAFRRSSASVYLSGTPSLTKATITTISWTGLAPGSQNGANGIPGYANWWSSGSPTRFTAPGACLAYATANVALAATSALGATGFFEVFFGKNGSTSRPNIQSNKTQPLNNTSAWQVSCVTESLWSLVAGDYLEVKVRWSGSPAGPFPIATTTYASIQVVAVP